MTSDVVRVLPHRLALARELRGLTKTELAKQIGKTVGAVSHFERGRAQPDSATVAALALRLGVPPEFFLRSSPSGRLSLEECHFRSLRSASQRERRQLLAFGTVLCELVNELERFVDLPPVDVDRALLEEHGGIEERALALRRQWGLGLGPIQEPIRLLEQHGIVVSLLFESCRRVDAFSGWHGERPFVFLLSDAPPSRLRFDAAHELGHLAMHADVVPGNVAMEREADRFGAAFLVPKSSFIDHWGRRRVCLESFFDLKRHWYVSAALLIRRAYDLGCIGRTSYQRLFRELSIGGRRNEPHETVLARPSLVQKAAAAAGIGADNLAALVSLHPLDVPSLMGAGDVQQGTA